MIKVGVVLHGRFQRLLLRQIGLVFKLKEKRPLCYHHNICFRVYENNWVVRAAIWTGLGITFVKLGKLIFRRFFSDFFLHRNNFFTPFSILDWLMTIVIHIPASLAVVKCIERIHCQVYVKLLIFQNAKLF